MVINQPIICEDTKFAVGIGLTNRCNLNCPHCYSRTSTNQDLSLSDIQWITENLNIDSVNLGTGESGLHPDFLAIIEHFHEKNIKMSLTTNGYTISLLTKEQLKWFNDIDFSLDFPNETLHDCFRGKNAFKKVLDGIEFCNNNGLKTSIVTVLMDDNAGLMGDMVELCRHLACHLRISVYKSVNTFKFNASFENFWKGIKLIFESSDIVACSEPIINAFLMHKNFNNSHMISRGGPVCGKESIRITPAGLIVPCTFLLNSSVSIKALKSTRDLTLLTTLCNQTHENASFFSIPEMCQSCKYAAICGGGCYARRFYRNIKYADEYCFLGKNFEANMDMKISFSDVKPTELVHSNYLCTLIVKPK